MKLLVSVVVVVAIVALGLVYTLTMAQADGVSVSVDVDDHLFERMGAKTPLMGVTLAGAISGTGFDVSGGIHQLGDIRTHQADVESSDASVLELFVQNSMDTVPSTPSGNPLLRWFYAGEN